MNQMEQDFSSSSSSKPLPLFSSEVVEAFRARQKNKKQSNNIQKLATTNVALFHLFTGIKNEEVLGRVMEVVDAQFFKKAIDMMVEYGWMEPLEAITFANKCCKNA